MGRFEYCADATDQGFHPHRELRRDLRQLSYQTEVCSTIGRDLRDGDPIGMAYVSPDPAPWMESRPPRRGGCSARIRSRLRSWPQRVSSSAGGIRWPGARTRDPVQVPDRDNPCTRSGCRTEAQGRVLGTRILRREDGRARRVPRVVDQEGDARQGGSCTLSGLPLPQTGAAS